MAEGVHKVVLYVNEAEKRFTITARKYRARLPGVDKQMSLPGWDRKLVDENLAKRDAEALRDSKRAEYEGRGYLYRTRKPLS